MALALFLLIDWKIQASIIIHYSDCSRTLYAILGGADEQPLSPPGVYILDALLVFAEARDALFRSSSPTCVYVVSCGISTVRDA